MNQTSRTDEPYEGDDGLNQSPNALSNDLTTNQDLNGIANSRTRRSSDDESMGDSGQAITEVEPPTPDPDLVKGAQRNLAVVHGDGATGQSPGTKETSVGTAQVFGDALRRGNDDSTSSVAKDGGSPLQRVKRIILTFGKFVGPGFMVSVAYIDPGNYATDIAAGASYQFRLLFIVLMSNLFAILLQSLSTKLGTVTGLNLAEANRAFLPRWLNYFLYGMAEIAIIATDIAEVIGTAIALNLLIPQLPLVAGCAISILDVMFLLFFYRPQGSMKGLRSFEFFVMLLVLAVVVCFCIELSHIENTSVGQVMKGYLPNNAVIESDGLYQACGILGATVMPHSLYLGSGLPQRRLMEYDTRNGLMPVEPVCGPGSLSDGKTDDKIFYVPSMKAIKHCLKYSYAELAISLFTFALFVNSAILIVAGASLYENPEALEADIFGIHSLLTSNLGTAAGTVFALALLFSGVSAGIVCTISGQMVCEGALKWQMKPWLRRLVTRSISITPSIIIAGAAGREKLNAALNGSQVALSIVLPFVSAPLIWYTCFNKYMTVQPGLARFYKEGSDSGLGVPGGCVDHEDEEGGQGAASGLGQRVQMGNDWWVCALAILIWLVIAVMNVANLVLLGLGK
ncbi:putative Natural resistance-associated macrophage protein-domain-containing protein [Seiridium cardinale]|uniref:Natural resistance-associated macrophage protein-domain-containing protein n=1 Tax=Seiridium cardinale TaxID=138064 RepID=A0ABR2Y243_9PEZI